MATKTKPAEAGFVSIAEPVRWGASAVVRQRGLGGLPHERLPKGFPDLRHLASGNARQSRTWRPG
ncbi:hypothetical protein PI95_005695 [Hassallia byssoidea VB512170]|uniref:Uncharacterized protein n=1 Tax=Hassallia byssoidea VB512170 TaxID=1304833 RepID=A0A846H503_9CYAN|nr:hypothetical protein [Hassalia byssoidea]NEU72078.1 hypothetical protein [Hassalia byssoidea VB512170]